MYLFDFAKHLRESFSQKLTNSEFSCAAKIFSSTFFLYLISYVLLFFLEESFRHLNLSQQVPGFLTALIQKFYPADSQTCLKG